MSLRYVIQFDRTLSRADMQAVMEQWDEVVNDRKVRDVFLHGVGAKIVDMRPSHPRPARRRLRYWPR